MIALSGFFSGSETALMTINRYRLRYLADQGNRSAQLTEQLLSKPDRLIGLILLGNNLANIFAAQIVTILALRLYGDYAIAIGGGIFTIVVLVFAEVTPKTIAANNAEKISFVACWIYWVLEKPMRPIVWTLNQITNRFVRLVWSESGNDEGPLKALSRAELRTVVAEAGILASKGFQSTLLNLIDLNQRTVEDIMVPRNEIVGIDLSEDWDEIVTQIRNNVHTRLVLFNESIDDVVGILHLRRILSRIADGTLDKEALSDLAKDALFVPEGTPLHKQLSEFQKNTRRLGLVVDEYGDIQGLITLEDILEEVIGEFTTDPSSAEKDIFPQPDGSFLFDGSVTVRDINKSLHWSLPTNGAKTLNGLILDYLETIPVPETSLKISDYPMEIVQTDEMRVVTVRVWPKVVRRSH
jgi:Mg2+/Co2+ transporter CorB